MINRTQREYAGYRDIAPFLSCDCDCDCCQYEDDFDFDYPTNDEENEIVGYLALAPRQVIFNNPATIVYWEDGTRTVVKCHKEDTFDPEKGLAMALLKKLSGNTGQFNTVLNNWMSDAIYQGGKNEH